MLFKYNLSKSALLLALVLVLSTVHTSTADRTLTQVLSSDEVYNDSTEGAIEDLQLRSHSRTILQDPAAPSPAAPGNIPVTQTADQITICFPFPVGLTECNAAVAQANNPGYGVTFGCLQAASEAACAGALETGQAQLAKMQGTGVYTGSKLHKLQPVVAEVYDGMPENVQHFSVAFVPSASCAGETPDLGKMQKKDACFSSFGSPAGWAAPVGTLINEKMPIYVNGTTTTADAQSVGQYFGKVCAPGYGDQAPRYDGKKYDKICDFCPGSCKQDDPFWNDLAFMCPGDVIFTYMPGGLDDLPPVAPPNPPPAETTTEPETDQVDGATAPTGDYAFVPEDLGSAPGGKTGDDGGTAPGDDNTDDPDMPPKETTAPPDYELIPDGGEPEPEVDAAGAEGEEEEGAADAPAPKEGDGDKEEEDKKDNNDNDKKDSGSDDKEEEEDAPKGEEDVPAPTPKRQLRSLGLLGSSSSGRSRRALKQTPDAKTPPADDPVPAASDPKDVKLLCTDGCFEPSEYQQCNLSPIPAPAFIATSDFAKSDLGQKAQQALVAASLGGPFLTSAKVVGAKPLTIVGERAVSLKLVTASAEEYMGDQFVKVMAAYTKVRPLDGTTLTETGKPAKESSSSSSGDDDDSSGMSTAAIVGIVIGSVLVVGMVLTLGYVVYYKRQRKVGWERYQDAIREIQRL